MIIRSIPHHHDYDHLLRRRLLYYRHRRLGRRCFRLAPIKTRKNARHARVCARQLFNALWQRFYELKFLLFCFRSAQKRRRRRRRCCVYAPDCTLAIGALLIATRCDLWDGGDGGDCCCFCRRRCRRRRRVGRPLH